MATHLSRLYCLLGGVALGTTLTGGLYAPWPWWLSLAQAVTAAALVGLGFEVDAENRPEMYNKEL
jgi:hypothetical protein